MIISNTEVTTKNICDVAHEFHFIKGVAPKQLPVPLYRGIIGHSALQVYYELMKEGEPVEVCRDGALAVLDKEIARIASETPEEFEQIQLIMNIRNLIKDYADVYRKEPFRVLEVEKKYFTPVDPELDIHYGLQLDTLIEMIAGEFRGEIVVMDHKFVYNFKTALDIQMDAQLPKYIKTLQDNGYSVSRGWFNQVRTRQMKAPRPEDLYRRSWIKSNRHETAQIWKEQAKVAREIHSIKSDPDYEPVRTMSYITCRGCMFQGPCKSSLDGTDVSTMLQAQFEPSKYGYTDLSAA